MCRLATTHLAVEPMGLGQAIAQAHAQTPAQARGRNPNRQQQPSTSGNGSGAGATGTRPQVGGTTLRRRRSRSQSKSKKDKSKSPHRPQAAVAPTRSGPTSGSVRDRISPPTAGRSRPGAPSATVTSGQLQQLEQQERLLREPADQCKAQIVLPRGQ